MSDNRKIAAFARYARSGEHASLNARRAGNFRDVMGNGLCADHTFSSGEE